MVKPLTKMMTEAYHTILADGKTVTRKSVTSWETPTGKAFNDAMIRQLVNRRVATVSKVEGKPPRRRIVEVRLLEG